MSHSKNQKIDVSDEEIIIKDEPIYTSLHNSFSDSFGSIFNSTIILLTTSLGVLYGYAYVFIHSCIDINDSFFVIKSDTQYSLNCLGITTLFTELVLCGIVMIFMYQGVATRREQFVIYAIRQYSKPKLKDKILIDYHPFGKKRKDRLEGFDIMTGLYGVLSTILISIMGVVFLCTFILIILYEKKCGFFPLLCVLITFLVLMVIICVFWNKQKDKYNDCCEKYNEINPQKNANTTE